MLHKLSLAVSGTLRKLAVSNISLYLLVRRRIAKLSFMLPHDPEFRFIEKLEGTSGIIIDVGANDGISARSFRKLSSKPILSFEANPQHIEDLKKLKKTDPNFEFHIKGLGSKADTLSLFIPKFKNKLLTNYASFSADHARNNLSEHMNIRKIENKVTFDERLVDVITLDSLNLQPSIIKIDVEGFEAEVLLGAINTIRETRPAIMVEYNSASVDGVDEILSPLGYHKYVFTLERELRRYHDGMKTLNIIFLQQNSLA